MQFTCLRENLSKGLNTVGKAVPVKSSFPMLSNVLIIAEDGRLKLAGTNLNTAIISYVGASVEEDGSITVPAKLLSEFVSHLSAETVSIKLKDDILHITSGSTRSKFNGADASDFPDLPDANSKLPFIEIDPRVFNTAISQVGFSVALDDSRPVFSGILLSYSTGVLTIVGSDGFRLSEKKIDVEGSLSDFAVVLPARTLLETARLFSTSDEKLKMYLNEDENLCLFEAGDTLVATRIIDGAYPDYQRIIPSDVVLTASFSSEELLEAVKLTSVFAKDSDNAIKIIVNPNGYIKVTSSSQETGENSTKVKAEVVGNIKEPFEIVFNARYLLEMLTNNKYDTLVFHAKERTSPCLIVPVDEESFLHVMAPMQLNG